eukprot:TRINITY_DN5370_c0_g1_i9.p1 TRINITY_DN5370_c0_g1~~TRINITY_DN5370_c0_g1_i9.p1  ORF type:complete len:119 (-),score=33.82 TRINITY_DN5370_c0_g1_i9:105-431(-)
MEFIDALEQEYERAEQIGKGAYGKVYKVKRKSDGEVFVSKQLSVSMLEDKELTAIQREIMVLSDLSHPYITQIVDCIPLSLSVSTLSLSLSLSLSFSFSISLSVSPHN